MKSLRIILTVLMIAVVGYNSVYFRKLDEVKASPETKEFNAQKYAETFWNIQLIPGVDKAVDLVQLVQLLTDDKVKAFETHSHALGIGNLRYFFVKGSGEVETIQGDYVSVGQVKIATEFIFGNQVRDATGLIDITEFTNTMDFNNVSAELNKIIRGKVLPPFKASVKKGDAIDFVGAIELNQEHLDLNNIEVIPVQLTIRK